MTEYAPDALHSLFVAVHARIPQAEFSGILGDSSHTYGYHRARAVLPSTDYSVQFAEDKLGNSWAASAVDIKLPVELMEAVSARLMAACKANDPRVTPLREWFGTLNGTVVTGWDRRSPRTPTDDCYTSSDDSHLWHIHLSVYREYADNFAALSSIADVIAGIGDDEMQLTDTISVPGPDGQPKDVTVAFALHSIYVNAKRAADVNRLANAVIAALPADKDGTLTKADVEAAMRSVFADAATP